MAIKTYRMAGRAVSLFLLIMLFSATAQAKIITVDDDANGANDGSTWADAYNVLQDALYGADVGDEIRVAQGTYKPGPPIDPITPWEHWELPPIDIEVLEATFHLKNSVVIKGGYAGFGQPDPDARDIFTYSTVLSGDLAGNDEQLHDPCDLLYDPCRADNAYSVVTGTQVDGSAVLDGFIITGGGGYDSVWYIFQGGPGNWGGGMFIEDGSPTVRNCTFRENRAGVGGGLCIYGNSSPVLISCAFGRNAAYEGGGGVYYCRDNLDGDWIASPTFTNCNFSENWGGEIGGGMYNDYSKPAIINCRFRGNRAYFCGGGLANHACDAILINCKFHGNLVYPPPNIGAFYAGGGAIYNWSSAPTIENCIFSGNQCDFLGGALFNTWYSCPSFQNCTLSKNWSRGGGIIACDSWNHGFPSNVRLTNCILWNGGSEILNWDESTVTITYSDVRGGWPGEGNINTDPCFVEPALYPPYSGLAGLWVESDYRLLRSSSCIDVGDPNYTLESNETDFDGKPRIIGSRIDMGAYEFQGPRDPCVFYVDDDAAGANNGSSWADAFNYLQDALTEARYGDTILVAQGTYKPDRRSGLSPSDCFDTFWLKNGVEIVGGYGGIAEQNYDARSVELYKTILSGDIGQPGFDGDNSYHVLMSCGTDASTVLDGFTVTSGRAERLFYGIEVWLCGGGMYNEYAHPTLLNCTFTENSAWTGGGLYTAGGNQTLNNCTFSDNSARGEDYLIGMFYFQNGSGGGMYIIGGAPVLTNCRFRDNMTGNNGGGLYHFYSDPMITNCTFNGNMALKNGGGICSDFQSSNVLTNCLFRGNVATVNGGGLCNRQSDTKLNNCTVAGNWAGSCGGGICDEGGDANITNCIFYGDFAAKGIEIYLGKYIDHWETEYPSALDVNYSDVSGCDTSIYMDANCTLNWGDGNIDSDPCFVDPGYWDVNGHWLDGDYHLLPDSPCIDSGINSAIPLSVLTDLEGNPRTWDGDNDAIPVVDMGAYEYYKASMIQAEVDIDPNTLNLNSKGRWITAFIRLPEEYNVADIDPNSILLEAQVKPERFWFTEDNQIAEAKFDREQVQAILAVSDIELTITGQLTDGTSFEASDLVKVIDKGGKK